MAVSLGQDFLVKVGATTGATPDTVGSMHTFSKSSSRKSDAFPIFDATLPITIPGTREQTYSMQGYLDEADTGQDTLRAAEAADTTVFLTVTRDGTNGFKQECRVTSFTYNTTPEGLQEISYEFVAAAAATIVGTGPIM